MASHLSTELNAIQLINSRLVQPSTANHSRVRFAITLPRLSATRVGQSTQQGKRELKRGRWWLRRRTCRACAPTYRQVPPYRQRWSSALRHVATKCPEAP